MSDSESEECRDDIASGKIGALVTIDDLIDELGKRCAGLVVCYESHVDGEPDAMCVNWKRFGPISCALGLGRILHQQLRSIEHGFYGDPEETEDDE